MILFGYISSVVYGLICLAIALIAYKLGVPKRYTRKIVHILVGFEWVILYHTFGVGIHFVAVALGFTLMLFITHKKSLMPMISSDGENSPGTVYYGVSMSIMAIISCFAEGYVFAFGIAVFCTSFGDGLAGVLGSSFSRANPKIYKSKSLIGTVSAFVFSFASSLVMTLAYELPLGIHHCAFIALLAAGLELITGFGLDNVALPLGVSLFSHMLMYFEPTRDYIVPIVATPFVIALALQKKMLTPSGVAFAVILDVAVSIALGNFGFVLLLAFLLFSVAVDKIKNKLRRATDEISRRGEHRDEIQVLANGIVPMAMAIGYFVTGKHVFVLAYTASLAECFSDTCASGFGMLSKKAFDPFRFKSVPVGLSGGMSVLGTLASFVAALAFPMIALAFGTLNFTECLVASLAAALGTMLDSMLGSLVQVKYKCSVCGIVTEKLFHCSASTERTSGFAVFNNDVVNVVSVAFAGLVSALLYLLIL